MKHKRALGALVLAGLLIGGEQAAAADPVAGAGSTFAGKMIDQWVADTKPSGVQVSYTGTGSGDGRKQLIAGSVDFAASDVAAPQADADQLRAKYGDFVHITITAGGISAVYNVADLAELKLSGPTLAKIYSGSITNWNDPSIAADNGAPGPDLPITVVFRSDKSGTSGVLTAYLSAAGEGNWTAGPTEQFPGPANGKGAEGGGGVAAEVANTNGAIGYTDHGGAMSKQLKEVKVKNPSGQFHGPETPAVQAALDEAKSNSDGTVTVNYTPAGAGAYPIVAVTYILAPTKLAAGKAETLKAFLDYALGAGQDKAPGLGYTPLPGGVRDSSKAQAAKITAG